MNRKIALVLGSDSDLPVAKEAFDALKSFGIEYEARVLSAHRTPDELASYASALRENGFAAVIAFAGMAAHLAGAIAARTTLPVIAVPCRGTNAAGIHSVFDGLDALLSSVQMPPGVPVATTAVNGGTNAALLAVQIIGVFDKDIAAALAAKKADMAKKVLEKDAGLK
ncbi:MAG: 5-(carboxyamino)imidazole ribonucleotide mutase [Spirochaetaceae bacterium]|jgi:5-(carboxyamino)imidazole ribonucleotide mutase|nr:5-(carboxyamino)imidazole ribonucleotide mutase [Spirochaetaceae bacterium]